MARKRRPTAHANHERWLVSYADFITLLFAFFVVMFASSQTDKAKVQQMSASMKKAIDGESVSMITAVLRGSPSEPIQTARETKDSQTPATVDLLSSLRILSEELKDEIDAGQIQIQMQPRGLVISFTQAALFPSGEDVISPTAYSGLQKVAAAIAKIPNPVRLEGHTDAIPISTTRFHSNWELSAARSIALLELLSDRFDIPRERLSIAGYADTAPVASNDTEEGRARNRRVDIAILNDQGMKGEPEKPTPISSQASANSTP